MDKQKQLTRILFKTFDAAGVKVEAMREAYFAAAAQAAKSEMDLAAAKVRIAELEDQLRTAGIVLTSVSEIAGMTIDEVMDGLQDAMDDMERAQGTE
jgi:hypothetical protein